MNDMTSTSIKRAAPLLSTLAFALVIAGCTNLPRIDDTTLPATPAAFKEGDGRWAAAAPAEAQSRGPLVDRIEPGGQAGGDGGTAR